MKYFLTTALVCAASSSFAAPVTLPIHGPIEGFTSGSAYRGSESTYPSGVEYDSPEELELYRSNQGVETGDIDQATDFVVDGNTARAITNSAAGEVGTIAQVTQSGDTEVYSYLMDTITFDFGGASSGLVEYDFMAEGILSFGGGFGRFGAAGIQSVTIADVTGLSDPFFGLASSHQHKNTSTVFL